jgi:hypothetical protein
VKSRRGEAKVARGEKVGHGKYRNKWSKQKCQIMANNS